MINQKTTEDALRWIMHQADAAKEPCGDDPESPAAIRNGKLASIALAAAQALGIVRGPSFDIRQPIDMSEWQPIETAPKDGSEIWAYNGEQARMKWISGDGYGLWAWADELLSDVDPVPEQPTHWVPLLEPPV